MRPGTRRPAALLAARLGGPGAKRSETRLQEARELFWSGRWCRPTFASKHVPASRPRHAVQLPHPVTSLANGRCAATRWPGLAFASARVSRAWCRGWLCPGSDRRATRCLREERGCFTRMAAVWLRLRRGRQTRSGSRSPNTRKWQRLRRALAEGRDVAAAIVRRQTRCYGRDPEYDCGRVGWWWTVCGIYASAASVSQSWSASSGVV